jgi:hypothetical protein
VFFEQEETEVAENEIRDDSLALFSMETPVSFEICLLSVLRFVVVASVAGRSSVLEKSLKALLRTLLFN